MRFLIVVVLASTLVVPAASGGNPQCADQWTGACPSAGNNGTSVIIEGSQTNPGSPGSPGSGNENNGTGFLPIGTEPPPSEVEDVFGTCLRDWQDYIGCFRSQEDPEPDTDDDTDPATTIPAITIDDVARFAPDPAVLVGEPGNLGVAGLPVNLVAPAETTTQSGSLFGFPIDVRFTPVGFTFVHGDGTSADRDTGGTTWEELGQAQFTPTDTSHTYRERGTYDARVDVRYTAEVDLGIGWFPLSGELTITGPTQSIRIFEAQTALVAYTCTENPGASGC